MTSVTKRFTASGDASSDSAAGTVIWGNPGRARTVDATDGGSAQANFGSLNQETEYLKMVNFNNNVSDVSAPLSADIGLTDTIVGFEVKMYGQNDGASTLGTGNVNDIQLLEAKLVVGGVISGSNRAANEDMRSANTLTVGGPTDLWGLTPTRAQVIASNFGVALRAIQTVSNTRTALISIVELTVYYSSAPPSPGSSLPPHRSVSDVRLRR